MPHCHRLLDLRFCGAFTNIILQTTVFVNNRLWAVKGSLDNHCNKGALIAFYPPKNVYIENILVICAPGDHAADDLDGCFIPHPYPKTWPSTGSPNTFVYGGGGGG